MDAAYDSEPLRQLERELGHEKWFRKSEQRYKWKLRA